MSLDGAVYTVRLLEIDIEKVKIDDSNDILWPCLGEELSAPIIDGVLLLYDATQPDKLNEATHIIGRFCIPSDRPRSPLNASENRAISHWLPLT